MKTCPQCNIPQEIYQFRKLTNDICMKCESLKVYEKMLKFLYTDIGLEKLDKSLEEIIVKSKYLTATYTVPLEKAIKYIVEGRAQVYKPDMIYRIDHEDENWIVRYEVLERDDYKCHYCGRHTDESVDHLLPFIFTLLFQYNGRNSTNIFFFPFPSTFFMSHSSIYFLSLFVFILFL